MVNKYDSNALETTNLIIFNCIRLQFCFGVETFVAFVVLSHFDSIWNLVFYSGGSSFLLQSQKRIPMQLLLKLNPTVYPDSQSQSLVKLQHLLPTNVVTLIWVANVWMDQKLLLVVGSGPVTSFVVIVMKAVVILEEICQDFLNKRIFRASYTLGLSMNLHLSSWLLIRNCICLFPYSICSCFAYILTLQS